MDNSGVSPRRIVGLIAGAAAIALPALPAAADETIDPAVVQARDLAAEVELPIGFERPPAVQPPAEGVATRGHNQGHSLSGRSTTGGYVAVGANDHARNDKAGFLTTTMRVWGNAAAWREGDGSIHLSSQFTCTGVGVSGVSIGASGVSVTGSSTSKTLTWDSSRSKSREVRQWYTDDGHFRCKASNASPARTTRRAVAVASYKQADTRAQDQYAFWW